MASTVGNGSNLDPIQKRQVEGYLAENEAQGAPVHSFKPDASPAEKAAVAGKASTQVQSIAKQATHNATGKST